MNKILVTGIALGKDLNVCQACNYDIEWLIRYPSILLWVDKILITETIWDSISKSKLYSDRPELDKSIKLIFNTLEAEKLIEIVDPARILTPDVKDLILDEIENDRKILPSYFPDTIRFGDSDGVPGQIFIDDIEYCTPYLWSIYAALLLSKIWNAESIYPYQVMNFVKYKFGVDTLSKKGKPGKIQAYHDIFQAYLPNIPVLPEYVINREEQSSSCKQIEECKDTYLSKIEDHLNQIIQWRSYDEVQQIKEIIGNIISTKEQAGEILEPLDIFGQFINEQKKVQKRINFVFPKVERWANLTTILSIPVAITGLSTGNMAVASAGAGLASLSQISKEVIGYLKNKYNWLGFINSDKAKTEDL